MGDALIKLNGTPISLLKFSIVVEAFLSELATILVVEVFPLLPVIAITLPSKSLIIFFPIFVKDSIVFFTYIIFLFFESLNLKSSTSAKTAPFLKAS